MPGKLQPRQVAVKILEHSADGMREAGTALRGDVDGHVEQMKTHLSRHAAHEIVARMTRRPAHPESQVARQVGLMHAAEAAVKYLVGEGLQYAADAAEAGAERLREQVVESAQLPQATQEPEA